MTEPEIQAEPEILDQVQADPGPGICYLVEIDVTNRVDPDDPRPIAAQSDELVGLLCDQLRETAPGAVRAEIITREELWDGDAART